MATIEIDGQKKEVKDGAPIADACEELGVPFACKDGVCGTCKVDVLEGADNLSQLTGQEKEMDGMDKTHRLACQCKIKKGTVKLSY